MRRRDVALILLLAGLAFGNSFAGPYQYDDLHSVKYNPYLRDLDFVPRYFVDPAMFSGQARGFMYRPLLLTTFALEGALGGSAAAARRVGNLFIHAATALACGALTFLVLRSATVAAAAAALFLVHPAHAEVVNYISARSDSLVALLYLLALIAWLSRRRAAAWGGHAAALLVKSVAVTLPAMAGLLASGSAVRIGSGRARRGYLGMVVLTVLYLILLWSTRFLQNAAGLWPRSPALEIWTQMKGLVYYVWLLVAPVRLSIDHPFRAGLISDTVVIVALATVLSVVVLAWRHRGSVPGWCALWFGIALSPYWVVPLNIIVAERRMYLASMAAVVLAAWAWCQFAQRRGAALGWLGLGLLALCLVLTVQRNQVWASEVSLWQDAVEKNPSSARARINLALAYRRVGDLPQARAHLSAGLTLDPDFAEGWVIEGDLARQAGEEEVARIAYERALAVEPAMEGVHHNLGNLAAARGQVALAISHYERALELNPGFAEARNNLGQALEAQGRRQAALIQYEQAVRDSLFWVHTDDPVGGAWYNLARLAETLGDRHRAREAFTETLRHLRHHPAYRTYADYARQRLRELGDREERE